ncbi:sensor histidine kinase [Metabacillus malikii]|uniref:histidine kinase n=1 Tax=Metabacillus malikii TaxID=1504265 RepID=A0ABT9ZES4_9BACI|nr:HAMP domain-containing sensor histidine kinase [Metabacillus malikii]MDQ0230729.1 two-component system sensor histidine kinase BaeS [Metabacillus malikii]
MAYKKLTNLLSKLVALNSFVILLVIILAGLSVKNYACYLVNSKQIIGQDFVDTLNLYLLFVSILAFLIGGLFHYITARNIIKPIKALANAAKEIKEGRKPTEITSSSSGEIKELIINFNAMATSLQSMQEQRENMLRDIAHELRTPLTNLNGYLEALQNNMIDSNPELFGSLLDESRRMTTIVELLTELNSWNHGNYMNDKAFHIIDLQTVINDTITTFQLKLNQQFSEQLYNVEQTKILANRDGLTQVFSNILQNIIDYNLGKSIEIFGEIKKQHYLLSFTHEGKPIDPEDKDLIFERFYRLDESRTIKSTGAGLGLAIAKSIVLAHNGEIGINTDGSRHTFWISLPMKIKAPNC